MRARALREQQVEAQRLFEATQTALAVDGDLLDAGERAEVEALLAPLAAAAEAIDADAVKAAVDALAHGTEEFAARRMDRSIRAALAGRRVDDLIAPQG
jgi:molecular chaperone HscA